MTKTKKVTVVFVHIGDILPKHLRKNIEFFKSTFPTQAICVIVDSYKVCIELKRMDVEYFVFSDETRHKINEVASKLGHDLSFRAGFWLTTLGRFFGLLEYINRFPETSVLQIENDVICFPNFPFYQFSQIEREIAFPLESPKLGIASILYLKSPRAAKILCDFVEKEVSSNSKTTDMIILGRLLLESQENILILPTFSNVSQLNPQFRNFSGIKAIMNARTYFGGIFDSVSIGQYLLGIDSRNNRGIRRSFVVNKNHLVDPSKVRMRFNPSGAEVLDRNDNISYLYSLHIHSKDLKAFIFPFNYHYFQKALDNSMYGEKKGLDFGEIFRMVRSKMSQKFK